MADLYSTLGVKRGAEEKAIKSAYRKLAKELHPDKNKDNPKAAARFNDVTKAYDILSDKDKRAKYDRGEIDENGDQKAPFGFGGGRGPQPGAARGGGFGGFGGGAQDMGGADDLLNELFGRRGGGNPFGGGFQQEPPRTRPQPGADVQYRLSVPFEDAAELKPQRVNLRNGKTIEVKLPIGFEDGQTVKLTGQGEEGPGGKGNALISLNIKPHRYFRKSGDDIRIDLPISLEEAVLGAKVRVPTTSGGVMLTIPKGTNGGTTMRLKGKGFSTKPGARGDLLVTLEIAIPKGDEALESFVKGWDAGRSSDPRADL